MTLAPDSLGPTICIGEILAEIVVTSMGEGFDQPLPMIGPFPSGAPAIFIDQCARMGGSAAIVGAVGVDDFGRMNLTRLQDDGVDVSGVIISPDHPTGTAFVRYRPDGDRDFVFNLWTSAAGQLRWNDKVDDVVSRGGHLHIMGTAVGNGTVWPIVERAVYIIKQRGGSVSLDPNLRKELNGDADVKTMDVIKMTDLLLPSGNELYHAAGLSSDVDEKTAVAKLFASGVSEIAIKRGENGSSCYESDGTITHASAFGVTEVDPTGAGDCFGGAYVAARRLGLTTDEALTYANAAGALNVTQKGPMEGAATREQLDGFIATERSDQ
ncbi:MAG: carbohydrate kinase family protein [Ruegeria sp.]